MGIYIEVAIGLIFTYLIISLMCTTINELWASFMKLRAKGLRAGVEAIIDDPDMQSLLFNTAVFKTAGKASGWVGPSYIPSKTFVLSLLDAIDPGKPTGVQRTADDIADAVDKIEGASDFKNTLAALVRQGGKDVESIRTEIAGWFDDMMERVSGVYKRKLQIISLVIGAALCLAFNVDSIRIGSALWADQALRGNIAGAAEKLTEGKTSLGDIKLALGDLQKQLQPLPVGWYGPCTDQAATATDQCFLWPSGWGWLVKLLGLLLSAAAVSLGAPFWFDLLKKLVNVRGSGAVPEIAETKPAGSGETTLSESLGRLADGLADRVKKATG